jgi:hypothetical protein
MHHAHARETGSVVGRDLPGLVREVGAKDPTAMAKEPPH